MSASAPQSKVPSPARTPRVSGSDERRKNNRPPGIHNMGMTCFLNSTFQALAATPAVIALLSHNPAIPLQPAPESILPTPVQDFRLTPCLDPNVLEPPLYGLLPVTRAFVNALYKNWTLKDNGGGTSGAGSNSSLHSMSLRELLRELAKKYDQYQEFDQQDAHELLRHLLDSMEMEEKDVIKRRPIAPSLPGMNDPSDLPPAPAEQIMEDEQLLPFVDALFGGELSSVVVCETCKGVSHTYEGFLDISLSMRGHDDNSRQRKRDRLRGLFKPRTPSSRIAAADSVTMSEPEGSDGDSSGRRLMSSKPKDSEDEAGATVKRAASAKMGLGRKTSIFRRKGERSVSRGLRNDVASAPSTAVPTPTPGSPGIETPTSASMASSQIPHPHLLAQQLHHVHQATPTAAQAAYIQRILYGPPGAPDTADPLAKLRAAHANGLATNGAAAIGENYGLIDALKSFTSVEVLEGDNAFACHKCWKIKNGKYNRGREKESDPTATSAVIPTSTTSSASDTSHLTSDSVIPTLAVPEEDDRSRNPFKKPAIARAASPLRQVVDLNSPREDIVFPDGTQPDSETELRAGRAGSDSAPSLSSVSGSSSSSPPNGSIGRRAGEDGDDESDGLSDSSDDESASDPDPAPERKTFFRPTISRSKSSRQHKHFVLRKAYKRYLIARAPEVLVFHIKRFKQTAGGVYSTFSSLKKMDDPCSFPMTFDLAPFMAPNRKDFKVVQTRQGAKAPYMDWQGPDKPPIPPPMLYKLYAIVVHMGSMVGGHYIAYVLVDPERLFLGHGEHVDVGGLSGLSVEDKSEKPTEDRRIWCYCSDTEIRPASEAEVLNSKAYLCFYEKVYHA